MEWIDLLERTTARFATVLETGDLEAPVSTCPGWTLADLGEHTRWVHAWAAHAVAEGTPDGDSAPPGLDRDSLVAGYRDAAATLVRTLRETPPDAPAWTFGPEQVSDFWRRRQVHEVTLHLYDALVSQDAVATWEIEPEVAWDGVFEVAELMYPRQVRLQRTAPLSAPLRLTATDVTGETMLANDVVAPEVGLQGTAADLLLTLWGRIPATGPAAPVLAAAKVTP